MEPFFAMATLTIKNIPKELYERLKALAKLRHRSLNSEIINSLEKAVGVGEVDPEKIRAEIREFRKKVKGTVSLEELGKSVNEGRS
jgi:plasmid stability protein